MKIISLSARRVSHDCTHLYSFDSCQKSSQKSECLAQLKATKPPQNQKNSKIPLWLVAVGPADTNPVIWSSIWTDNECGNDPVDYFGPLLPPELRVRYLWSVLWWLLVRWDLDVTQYFKSHSCPLLTPLLSFSNHKDSMCAEAKAPPSYYQSIVSLLTHTREQWSSGWGKWRGSEDDLIISQLDSPDVHLLPHFLTLILPPPALLPSRLLSQMRIMLCCLFAISEQKKHGWSPEGERCRRPLQSPR